jgi:hypothetical protein
MDPIPNAQAAGPPLVSYLRLLIQYICSYPLYLAGYRSRYSY